MGSESLGKSLANLVPAAGSNKAKKRIGRGPGSGNGKTAGKGHKGQKARKGGKVAAGFEGGQTPLYRRLPKRGFKNPNRRVVEIVNLKNLSRFAAGEVVDSASLFNAGLINSSVSLVKLLGSGSVSHALKVRLSLVSKGAAEAVKKAGGVIEEI